jgi:hypothetical protein
MLKTRFAVIIAAFALMTLAGCESAATPADPAPVDSTPRSTAVASPSPSPTLDPADVSRWIVDFDGIGPVQLGKPFSPDLPEVAQFTLGTDLYCDERVLDLKPESGAALANQVIITTRLSDDQTIVGDYVSVSMVQAADSPPILRTEKGIGIGSTESEAKAAYPTGVSKSIFDDGRSPYLSVPNGSGHFILFHFGDSSGAPVISMSVQDFENTVYEFC